MLEFRHPDTKLIYDYWRSLGDLPPSYRLWDPIKIPKLMPYVLILQRHPDGGFAYRFAGTATCDFAGMELTGRPMGEVMSRQVREVSEYNLDQVLTLPCGLVDRSVGRSSQGRVSELEYVTLPLRGEDGVPSRAIVHMALVATRGFGECEAEVESPLGSEFFDLGFGTPTESAMPSSAQVRDGGQA